MMKCESSAAAIIEKQLEQIQKAYTLERINAVKNRMEAFWRGEIPADRFPYTIYNPPKNIPEIPEGTEQDDKELIIQLQVIIERADWDVDFYPALFPGVRQVIIPSYFGCTEEFASASTRVKPAINDPKDVYSLPDVGFGPETPGGEILERMRSWRKKTHGLIPLYEADMQGPFSVASQIWGVEEFLLAMYDYPEEVHHLLQRCTDAVIKYVKLMQDAAEGELIPFHCMPALWYPQEKGVAVSEDLAAVVSPQIIREFVRPYLEQIAAELGGVFMHSCGSLNNVITELNEIKGLVGLNFSSVETNLEELVQKSRESLFIVVHSSPINRIDLPLLSPVQHAEFCGKIFNQYNVRGLCIIIPCTGEIDPLTDSEALLNAMLRR